MTPTTTTAKPRLEPRSDYEVDDVASKVLIRTWEAALEEERARQVPPGRA